MNPTNSSTNNTSLHPKPQQHFFPEMEENPPHLYGPSNPNHAGGHFSSSVHRRTVAAGPFLCYSHCGIRLCSGGSNPNPVCLKHGKRHCGNKFPVSSDQLAVRRRNSSPRTPPVLRCQVQGCHVSLENAKDYQQRHKVCEMHSKASKAIVLGLDQRFCQRCFRFHVVSEFDGSKRSCRRKLADHNQRRRRKTTHDSLVPEEFIAEGALSLLSTTVNNGRINTSSPSDISTRSSAVLGDLITENHAATFSSNLHHNFSINQEQQLPLDYQSDNYNYHQILADPKTGCERQEGAVTLDLMGAPTASALGFLSESRHMNKD